MDITNQKPRKRVALFGGSFNPPHKGHTEICEWVFRRGIADELWLIPCYIHPLGKKLEPFECRLEMCRLAFSKLNLPIKILDVERELGGPSHTLRTIEHLRKMYPDYRFLLITGADIASQSKEWHHFDKIEALVDMVRVPRGKESPIPDISSTEIRSLIREGKPYREMVEPEVAIYIVTKALYR